MRLVGDAGEGVEHAFDVLQRDKAVGVAGTPQDEARRRRVRDFAAALQSQDRLIRLHKALFADASPSPTKFALAHLGLCTDETRLPIVPCSEAARAEVLAGMRDAGLIN